MSRRNFLHDEPWDEINEEHEIRSRVFWRPRDAMTGASLHELLPGSPGFSLHMHYGGEEMFFVVSGTPTLRNDERLTFDSAYCQLGSQPSR